MSSASQRSGDNFRPLLQPSNPPLSHHLSHNANPSHNCNSSNTVSFYREVSLHTDLYTKCHPLYPPCPMHQEHIQKKSWYKKVHWTYNALQCLEMSKNAQEVYFISTRRSPSLQENYFAECNISTKTVPVVFKGSQIARQAANQLPASTWPSLSSRPAVQ